MINVAQRIIKQMRHDKRSMAMMIVVPLVLLTLLYLLLGKSTYVPKVATDNLPSQVVTVLEKQDGVKVVKKDSTETNKNYIKNGHADAVIWMDKEGFHVLMLEKDSVKVTAVTNAVKAAVAAQIQPLAKSMNLQLNMGISFIYGGENNTTFDNLGSLLLGVLAFFLIFIFSGISFVRERTSDTVERLMLTPVKTASVVGGYMLGFGIFAVIQSTLLILLAKFVLDMRFVGHWWLALIIMLLLAMVAVALGTLVSAVSKNEFQVMQFIPVIIVPQIFFSGLIPVDTLPYHLDILSRIMPLYYGSEGMKKVLVYGSGFGDVLPQMLVLCGFIVVLFGANILAVKKYRAV